MRELTALEISQVAGRGILAESTGEGAALGTIVGAIYTNTLWGAARGGTIGAVAGATFGASYGFTSWALDQIS